MRAPATVLMLVVLALRSLLPAGFMVQAAPASGAPEIVICTGTGERLMHVDADAPAPAPKPQHLDTGLCPYAAAGAAALAAAAPDGLAGTATYAAVTYTLAAALFAETPKPGATSARGPPSQSI